MAKVEEKPKFKVKFIQPFEGSFSPGGVKTYSFKVTSRQIWPQGKKGMKTPVEMEVDNEAVYDWLKKFEQVSA